MVRIPVAGAEAQRYYAAMYDAWNQLTQVNTGGVPVARYSYDGAQRRIRKATPAATNEFFYDGWLLIQETQSGTGVSPVTNVYVWGLDLSGTLQGAGGIGGLLSILTPDSCPLTPVSDANGNVTKLLTSTGTVAASYVYDPYGRTISMSGPASTNNAFRFSSKYHDEETGLYYYGCRFYSPQLGRWISRDPVDAPESLGVYIFVSSSPIDRIDPTGLFDGKFSAEVTTSYDVFHYDYLIAQPLWDPLNVIQEVRGTWEYACEGVVKCTVGIRYYEVFPFSRGNPVYRDEHRSMINWPLQDQCRKCICGECGCGGEIDATATATVTWSGHIIEGRDVNVSWTPPPSVLPGTTPPTLTSAKILKSWGLMGSEAYVNDCKGDITKIDDPPFCPFVHTAKTSPWSATGGTFSKSVTHVMTAEIDRKKCKAIVGTVVKPDANKEDYK